MIILYSGAVGYNVIGVYRWILTKILALSYANKRIVNMKVYIERNNLQLKLLIP